VSVLLCTRTVQDEAAVKAGRHLRAFERAGKQAGRRERHCPQQPLARFRLPEASSLPVRLPASGQRSVHPLQGIAGQFRETLGQVAGDEIAQAIQLAIEYDPQPPYDAGSPDRAPAQVVARLRSRSRFILTAGAAD
jgi:hypothetical protein